jgi:hypothetical protein
MIIRSDKVVLPVTMNKQTKEKDNETKGMFIWLFSQGYMIKIMSDYINKKSIERVMTNKN